MVDQDELDYLLEFFESSEASISSNVLRQWTNLEERVGSEIAHTTWDKACSTHDKEH